MENRPKREEGGLKITLVSGNMALNILPRESDAAVSTSFVAQGHRLIMLGFDEERQAVPNEDDSFLASYPDDLTVSDADVCV